MNIQSINCTLELSKLHSFSQLFMFENSNLYWQLNFFGFNVFEVLNINKELTKHKHSSTQMMIKIHPFAYFSTCNRQEDSTSTILTSLDSSLTYIVLRTCTVQCTVYNVNWTVLYCVKINIIPQLKSNKFNSDQPRFKTVQIKS